MDKDNNLRYCERKDISKDWQISECKKSLKFCPVCRKTFSVSKNNTGFYYLEAVRKSLSKNPQTIEEIAGELADKKELTIYEVEDFLMYLFKVEEVLISDNIGKERTYFLR